MTSIDIQRFGPISDGQISLSPLTILTGPNGSGKSYAAMVLHSLSHEREFGGRFPFLLTNTALNEVSEDNLVELQDIQESLINNGTADMSPNLFNRLMEFYYTIVFENKFNDSLEKVFATDIPNLIKQGHRNIRLEITDELGTVSLVCWSNDDGLEIQGLPSIDKKIALEVVDNPQESMSSRIDDLSSDELAIPVSTFPEERKYSDPEPLLANIFSFLSYQLDLRYRSSSHYLPAGRAGLLQSHEVLTTGAFDRLSRVGIEPIEVPAFSGVVSNYLQEIVSLSNEEKGELSGVAEKFEESAIDGKVNIESDDEKPHPQIKFRQSGTEYPLHLASTSVSELSPLILYTKFILSPDSTIVIEEPEAHLHPENQRKVAYFIAKLVELGVRVIVTTHSDFIIEQLNNLIRISQIDEELRGEEGLQNLPTVSPNDVSVNMFSECGSGGFAIEEVEVDGVDGIPLKEFERVSDELYGESYKIDKLLQDSLSGDLSEF